MFSPRWSTFTLLSLTAVAALFAFYGGRLSSASRPSHVESNPPLPKRETPPTPLSQPTEAISTRPSNSENLKTRWDELVSQPGNPAVENEMAALIEKLAEQDPQKAISLAASQNNRRRRSALL